MNSIEEFKQKRIEGRRLLFIKIVSTFETLSPVAIHQFGSGSKGFKDEFSDIDIWITVDDEQIDKVLADLHHLFKQIAPVLVKHHSKSWSPVGGSANSIIHETKEGLFIVDYYISRLSETVIKEDSVVIYGDDSLKRGEWRINMVEGNNARGTHTLKKDVDLFINLIFISVKKIARKQYNDPFFETIKQVHRLFRKRYTGKLKRRLLRSDLKTDLRLLSDLYLISNKRQKRAINKIKKFIRDVQVLY